MCTHSRVCVHTAVDLNLDLLSTRTKFSTTVFIHSAHVRCRSSRLDPGLYLLNLVLNLVLQSSRDACIDFSPELGMQAATRLYD